MADRADAQARTRRLDLRLKCGAFLAVLAAGETQLHQLVAGKLAVEFRDESRRHAILAEPDAVGRRLAKTAKAGFLCTGEGGKIGHVSTTDYTESLDGTAQTFAFSRRDRRRRRMTAIT